MFLWVFFTQLHLIKDCSYPSLTASISICVHSPLEVFSIWEIVTSSTMRCLDRSFFFPPPSLVLYNFLFPIFFFFTFVHLKVKYHQTKAKQQPALGQEPRESSNLQLSAWSKGRDYCHLNPLPPCNFHHFLLLCSLVYYKPRHQSRGLTWREAHLILLGNYVIFQGNVHLAVDKIKSNKTNFRSDII